jgi:predicted dehydrogenase
MSSKSSRREFMKQSAAVGVAFWVAGTTRASVSRSPNEKLNIACIGVGGKGSSDSDHAGHYANIVALCDIDDKHLDAKAEKFPHAKKFNDFRKMLEAMAGQIDAVTVSTADHTHAPASVMAMKMGKHVYCQKPLTHTVHEARVMRRVAEDYKVATQMGNQGTSHPGFRQGIEVIRAGAIGNVREVHVWTNRPTGFWKQAPDVVARPTDTPPVPDNVHWNEFLGPAPERPYNPMYHPFAWRGWWDFGTGALGDMGCHTANMAFMALELKYPTSVEAESGEVNPETYPAWATVRYEFPARGDAPPVRLTWYEGTRDGKRNLPSTDLVYGEKLPSSGLILIGDKGVMFSPNDYGAQHVLLPKEQYADYTPPEPTLPRNGDGGRGLDRDHKGEWIAACTGGPAAFSNFGYAGLLTETILLGNVAIRAGSKLDWDGPNFKFTNAPDAQQLLHYEYRKGWVL